MTQKDAYLLPLPDQVQDKLMLLFPIWHFEMSLSHQFFAGRKYVCGLLAGRGARAKLP